MLKRFALAIALLGTTAGVHADLRVDDLGKAFDASSEQVVIQQYDANTGGSTSIRNTDESNLIWKDQGYFQRNRDLGQVFTPEKDFQLHAIVLRTGPSDAAVLPGAPGAEVFVQFFEVAGKPTINDNGTPPGSDAKHGFTKNHRADDFIEGTEYQSIHVATGGKYPNIPPTRGPNARPDGKFRYLKWRLTGEDLLTFRKGKRYAFMIGFVRPGKSRGFTLANSNAASANGPAVFGSKPDHYPGGWAIRREGNSATPTKLPNHAGEPDAKLRERLVAESLFPVGKARYSGPPTTDGHPDVDTYRDMEFYLISE